MSNFVIAGKSECLKLTHAVHVAEFLSDHLPSFRYRSIVIEEDQWPSWLDQLNSVEEWCETRSPVIWKELDLIGGKKYRIGSLNEFWEYCYDYYGFETTLSKTDLEKILEDNRIIQSKKKETSACIIHSIGIIGALNIRMLQLVLYEIQNCESLKNHKEMEIKFYDQKIDVDPEEEEMLLQCIAEFKDWGYFSPSNMILVTSLKQVIDSSDLLIIIDDYSRQENEEMDMWLERCRQSMLYLSGDINYCAKRTLRIILSHQGPVCFNASLLMEYCTTIKLTNIVAVTADEGIAVIDWLSKKTEEPVKNFFCPPVWGFSGLMSYISIPATCLRGSVKRPFKRSLTSKDLCKLPKGTFEHELRFLRSIFDFDDSAMQELEAKQDLERRKLGRGLIYPKVRALGSLLRLWFSPTIDDDIISLGICSNGVHGFPVGICFSQPVLLNEDRIWEPLTAFTPFPETVAKISAISLQVENTVKPYGLGERFRDNLESDNDK